MNKFETEILEKIRNLQFRISNLERTQHSVTKGEQMLLSIKYREMAAQGIILNFEDVGFQNFSQFEEDGILHYIFSLIGFSPKTTVELCAGIGSESMSANLILNHRWHSLLVDGNEKNVQQGIRFFSNQRTTRNLGPIYQHKWIDRESVNDMLTEAGFSGDVGLLALDLDGVDYWIWDAITVISPRVVVVECLSVFQDRPVTVPYDGRFVGKKVPLVKGGKREKIGPEHVGKIGSWTQYGGASLPAYCKLAKSKGYRLIGANAIGNNAFFMRNDIGQDFFPETRSDSCLAGKTRAETVALCEETLSSFPWEEV